MLSVKHNICICVHMYIYLYHLRNYEYIFISLINQLDAQNFCFTINLFQASTCFEHMCSSSGSQNCITQPLVSSHLTVKQKFCASSWLITEINILRSTVSKTSKFMSI